jgi:hypothetical protein
MLTETQRCISAPLPGLGRFRRGSVEGISHPLRPTFDSAIVSMLTDVNWTHCGLYRIIHL